jgi:hypothetical protein
MQTLKRFLWTAFFVANAAAVVRAENPAENLGFERESLAPWQFAALGGAQAVGEVDAKVFHSGRRSLRIANASPQAAGVFGMLSQRLHVTPNTRYEFSVWGKGQGVGNAWIGGGPGWELRVRFPAGTYEWQKFTGTFFTKPTETAFDLIIAVESPTQGLWLDDVQIVAVATLTPDQYTVTATSLAPPEAVARFFGPNLPPALGLCVFGFPQNPSELDQLAASGATLVRTDMHWADAEPRRGNFDEAYWKTVMDGVDSYAKRGIRMLFILDYGNPVYGGGWGEMPGTPERRAAFARFAAAAAERFKSRNVIFELWNEPDGAVTAEEYMALAKVTIPAMRKANPNVVLIGPAAHHYATAWLERCYGYGLLNLCDAVSVHLYFGMPPQPQPIPELNGPLVEAARKLVAKYANGRTVPIVNSEWGYKRSAPNEKTEADGVRINSRERAAYVPRMFLLSQLWELKFSVGFCWWLPEAAIKSDGDYGLLTADHRPTPAYDSMATLGHQLPNGRLKQRVATGSQDDYVLKFDTAKGIRWAVWTTRQPHAILVPVGNLKKVRVTDVSGSRSFSAAVDKPGAISLQADGEVQYLRED